MTSALSYLLRRYKTRMTALELYHLLRLSERYNIDTEEIDHSLTYYENKAHLLQFIPRNAEDYIDYATDQEEEELERRLIDDCKDIIYREKCSLKQAKLDIGRRILEDEDFLNAKYGDNYFGKLARKISERGYGPDQLRKCVRFARHSLAEEWVGDGNISWERIRTELLVERDSIGSNLFDIRFLECLEVMRHLVEVCNIKRARSRDVCRRCAIPKLCSRINSEIRRFGIIP